MKKRILSILLAAVMVVSLLPVTAFAAEGDRTLTVTNLGNQDMKLTLGSLVSPDGSSLTFYQPDREDMRGPWLCGKEEKQEFTIAPGKTIVFGDIYLWKEMWTNEPWFTCDQDYAVSGDLEYFLPETCTAMCIFDSHLVDASGLIFPRNLERRHLSTIFIYCMGSLEKGPSLPAGELVDFCYAGLFQGCSKLSSLTVDFTSFSFDGENYPYTDNWLNGVAEKGTIYVNEVLLEEIQGEGFSRNESTVPSGWTVVGPKSEQSAPNQGVGYTLDYAAETMVASTGYEVSSTNGDTATALTDNKVTPGTTYYVRLKETDTANASPWTANTIPARPTKADTPVLASKTDTSITVTAVAGQEYSIDNGTTWVSDGGDGDGDATTGTVTFSGLTKGETYGIVTRAKAVTSGSMQFAGVNSDALSVTAEAAAPTYAITNGTTDTNGSITVAKTAAEGETVTVTVKPADGYALKTLKYNDGEDHTITVDKDGKYTFTMPAKAVTVTAEFEATTEKPVDQTLYWGFDNDTKAFYFSKTAEAITDKGATPNAFDSTQVFRWDTDPVYPVFPWKNVCESVQSVEILNDIAPGSTACWFYLMSGPKQIKGIEHLYTGNVTSMWGMFASCRALESLDVSHFDTSAVTCMNDIFRGCEALTELDVSNFDTSNVTSMEGVFAGCAALESLDVSNFNTSNVEYMTSMFENCTKLQSLDLSNFDTPKVTYMTLMFGRCSALRSLDLSGFKKTSVKDMKAMFYGCSSLASLDLSEFDTTSVTTMESMFEGCSSLASVDLPKSGTPNLTKVSSMFKNCTSLKTVDLSNFDLSKCSAGTILSIFSNCSAVLIKTPKNLGTNIKNAKLPVVADPVKWLYADTLNKYESDSLPTGQANSITLVAGVPVQTWSALQDEIDAAPGTAAEPATATTNFILAKDLTAPATGGASITIPVGKDITIDLNGKVLNANGGAFSVIEVAEGGKLTLIDSKPTTEHYFTVGNDGLWTLTNTKTDKTKTVNGGVITGGVASGGGVSVNGIFNMNGGNITGNTATTSYGGGVFVDITGQFTMSGGAISGNMADFGGGVCAFGTFNMTAGEISGNKASAGGGVCVYLGTFNMSGSKVSGNEADSGGGVYVYNGYFLMGYGEISGNKADYGGGVYSYGATALCADEGKEIKITGNAATVAVGGVVNYYTMYLSGKVIIKDNICTNKYDDTVNYPVNLATFFPINIYGALTGSEIYVTHVNEDDEHDAGVLTSGFITSNEGAKLGDFFHYGGPDNFEMVLNEDGELEVKAIPRYTTYKNWQIKHDGTGWEFADMTKVSEGLYKIETNWTTSETGFNVQSDENHIKKYWYAADDSDVIIAEGTTPSTTVDVYLRVIDDNTLKIGVGVVPPAPAPAGITTWSALQDAIGNATASPTTIKLTDDLTAPEQDGASITIPNGKDITLDLNGKVLNANGGAFSVITVEEGGKLTLIDSKPETEHYFTVGNDGLWTLTNTKTDKTKTVNGGVITGGKAKEGGGVNVDEGTFNMSGGNIVGNTATENGGGGGVHVNGTGSFSMSGGNIVGNAATSNNGGGVSVANDKGSFTMSGNSKITNNIAKRCGGGVFVSGGFKMTGGEISGNNAENGNNGHFAGGVFFSGTTLTLGGTAKITGNTAGSTTKTANNLYLYTNKTVTLGTGTDVPKDGMSVGVTTLTKPTDATPTDITTNGEANDANYFSSDDSAYEVNFKTDHLELTKTVAPAVEVTTWSDLQNAINNAPGNATTPATQTTLIKLTNDLTVPAEGGERLVISAGKNIVLDLNGFTFDRGLTNENTAVDKGNVFTVNGKLTIQDNSTAKTGKITGGTSAYGAAIISNGETILEGGTITGCKATSTDYDSADSKFGRGGAIYVPAGGEFTMTGGEIKDCSASVAGGAIFNAGTVNITGGKIDGCSVSGVNDGGTVKAKGGAVYNFATSHFTMTGGEISGNTLGDVKDMRGAGVYAAADANITLGGTAKITGNADGKKNASNIFLYTGETFTIDTEILPATGMQVGVTTQTKPTDATPTDITTNGEANDANYFSSDDSAYKVNFSNNHLELKVSTTDKPTADSKIVIDQVVVAGNKIKSGDTEVEVKTASGTNIPTEKLNDVASATNAVLNNKAVASYTNIGLDKATEDSNDTIVAALKAEATKQSVDPNLVTDTDIDKYLNIKLVSATVDTDKTVTVTAMTFDVTPMATITVTGEGDKPVTLTTEIDNYVDGEVTFRLPVDGSIKAETAAVYHEAEFIGNKDINSTGKYIEVKTDSFSKFSYIVLDETTAGAKIGDTLYASLADAVSEVTDGQTITLLKDASDTITVFREVEFTVEENGMTNGAAITAGVGYTMQESGNTYTFTKDNSLEQIIKQFFDWLFGRTEPEQPDQPDVCCVVKTAAAVTATVVVTKIIVDRLHALKTACDTAAEATPVIKAEEMPMVAIGSSGDAVTTLQTKLNELGYNCGEVDGVFGNDTYTAVCSFQTAKGLTADGMVGKLTWDALL